MRIRVLLAAAALALAASPAYAEVLIHVDKSIQQMTVTVDGHARYVWPVSTGIARYDTPDGSFKPFRMEKDHFSKEWDDAPMPYSIFFTKLGHAIHGTNHTSIGRPASHGCVRLSVAHAAQLWDLVKSEGMNNTKVVLTGEIPGAPAVARDNRRRNDEDVTGALGSDAQARAYYRRYNSDDYYYQTPSQRQDAYYYRERPYYQQQYQPQPRYREEAPPPFPFFFGR